MGDAGEAEVVVSAQVNSGILEWEWVAHIPLTEAEGAFYLQSQQGFMTPEAALEDARKKLEVVVAAGGPEQTHFLELNYPKES